MTFYLINYNKVSKKTYNKVMEKAEEMDNKMKVRNLFTELAIVSNNYYRHLFFPQNLVMKILEQGDEEEKEIYECYSFHRDW